MKRLYVPCFLCRAKYSRHLYHAPGPAKANFFAAVGYYAGDNRINGIRSFRTNRLLEPYPEKVKLAGLGNEE